MENYPIFLNLRDQPCLVVGGGEVATRKLRSLIESNARVVVIAPDITKEIATWSLLGKIKLKQRKFEVEDLSAIRLVIAATCHSNLNRLISELAESSAILVNVVDDPAVSRFITPSIVERSPLTIAISSGGKAPILTRLIRQKLETLIPFSYGRLASFAGRLRGRVKNDLHSLTARRLFWENTLDGPIAERVLNGQEASAMKLFDKQLACHAKAQNRQKGEVFIVGAGPGDPELVTLKALRLMQQADVVFYDNLVSSAVLDLIRRDALKIFVGKKKGSHSRTQKEINKDLIRLANEGKRVCRLKGGDPYIFGRGGEEVEALVEADIPFQVIPGISAANGCSTYAGIPLTHRGYADNVMFIAGQKRNDGGLDFQGLNITSDRQTLVFYMGLGQLDTICKQLLAYGLACNTPAAAIENGTGNNQRTLLSNIEYLAADVENVGFRSPTLIIVGQVVRLAKTCHWFGEAPVQYTHSERSLDEIPQFSQVKAS